MAIDNGQIRDRVKFLSQPAERLRQVRGRELYETLGGLGMSHAHFFRALETNAADYCAQEFGVDLNRISVDRFFASDPNAKWLFPDIVREAVLSGMRRKPVYPQLIARDEPVEGSAFDVPFVNESEEEEELRTVAEGAAIPESQITYGERIVRLEKRGRGVLASYEVVRRMSVDMLRIHLERMGERLGQALDLRCGEVLRTGDGSGAGTAPVVYNTKTPDTFAFADLVSGLLGLRLLHGFSATHFVASPLTATKILELEEIKDSNLFAFARDGEMPNPLGMKLVVLANQPDSEVTVLDANYAVQKLTEQDVTIESDKLIHQQWDRTYFTVVTDFAVLYEKARVVLNSDWTAAP